MPLVFLKISFVFIVGMVKMNKLLVICGPTATGKTSLGINLAKKFDGEIINADSRQVYRGMDVGTGKDLPEISNFKFQISKIKSKEKKYNIGYYLVDQIPIWLLDIVEPDYRFSVADYVNCAVPTIEGIWERGKLSILVGGTGFYIKALIDGIDTIGIEPDWGLREKFQSASWRTKTQKLQEFLKRVDIERFNRMNQSDKSNPRRLIRAIEVGKNRKSQIVKLKTATQKLKIEKKDLLIIGLKTDYEKLYERIDERVEKRLKQGLLKEIRKLVDRGYAFNNSVLGTTLAYREWREYFKNDKLKKDIVQKWKYDEYHYARRQMTWFRKEKRINWFDIAVDNFPQNVEKLIEEWYID